MQSGFGSGWDAFQRGEGIDPNPYKDWRAEEYRDGWRRAEFRSQHPLSGPEMESLKESFR